MMQMDCIIAVKDVQKSAKWYETAFNCKNKHGGENFAVLVTEKDEILICLHQWEMHEHPTMQNPNIVAGNGLILYFRTENMKLIRENLEKMQYSIEKEIAVNENSLKMEFSVRDLDGYYLTITDFHKYEG